MMGQNYDQLKEARMQSKTQAISEILAQKGSSIAKVASIEEVLTTEESAPKRRGRPPRKPISKATAKRAAKGPLKRRGRPPKKVEPTVSAAPPKRRGRPPKVVKTAEETVEAEAPKTSTPKPEKAKARKKTKINDKEIAILSFLNGSGRGRMGSYKIADIAAKCFPSENPEKANAWVRASLRRPVSESWVEKAARGEYRLNLDGRRVLKEATA
jgi:hypothetical protein